MDAETKAWKCVLLTKLDPTHWSVELLLPRCRYRIVETESEQYAEEIAAQLRDGIAALLRGE
jgi:hypothetical protein